MKIVLSANSWRTWLAATIVCPHIGDSGWLFITDSHFLPWPVYLVHSVLGIGANILEALVEIGGSAVIALPLLLRNTRPESRLRFWRRPR